jgi:hypothetical protein
MREHRWGAVAGVVALVILASAAEAHAQRCRTLASGIEVCATRPTVIEIPDDQDSVLIARAPAADLQATLAVYFPVSPAKSLTFRFDPSVKDVVTGPWIEVSARVASTGVRVDQAPRVGALAALSARIARVVPKGSKLGNLTASAGPKGGARVIHVAVTDHGTVVWESTVRSGDPIAILPDWPTSVRAEMRAMGGLEFGWRFTDAATIRVKRTGSAGDSSVTGDELRITGSSGAGMSLTQVHFQAAGVDTVRFSGAEVVHGSFLRPRVKPRVKA